MSDSQRLLASQGGIVIASMLTSALLARHLGVAMFGTYSGLVRWGVLLSSVISLSYGHGLAQEVASGRAPQLSRLWRGAVVVGVAVGAIAAVSLLVVSMALGLTGAGMYLYFSLGLPAAILAMYAQHLLRGVGDVRGFAANRATFPVLFLMAVGGWAMTPQASHATVGVLWSSAQWMTLAIVYLRVRRHGVRLTRERFIWRAPLGFGLSSHVAVVGRDVSQYVDQLILVAIGGVGALGLYVPGAAMAALVSAVGVSVTLMVQPEVAGAAPDRVGAVAWGAVLRSCGYALPLGIAVFGLSQVAILLMYGPDYSGSASIARPLALGMVCDVVTLAVVASLLGMGRPRIGSLLQAGLTICLAAAVLAGYQYSGGSALGAAYGVLVANAVGAVVAIVLLWRFTGRGLTPVRQGFAHAFGK